MKRIPQVCEKLLAEHPDLQFNRSAAYDVCQERCFIQCMQTLETLPKNATLSDFLATFPYDHSAEEFLLLYIKLMT